MLQWWLFILRTFTLLQWWLFILRTFILLLWWLFILETFILVIYPRNTGNNLNWITLKFFTSNLNIIFFYISYSYIYSVPCPMEEYIYLFVHKFLRGWRGVRWMVLLHPFYCNPSNCKWGRCIHCTYYTELQGTIICY